MTASNATTIIPRKGSLWILPSVLITVDCLLFGYQTKDILYGGMIRERQVCNATPHTFTLKDVKIVGLGEEW